MVKIGGNGRGVRKGLLVGISTNVLVLGLVSLLTDTSSEMIYPILPLFLTSIGATGVVIGLIEGAAETTASFLKVISGWYSDKFRKRKDFILAGYGLSTIAKPTLALVTSYWQVLGIRIVERVGKGIRSAPRDALIADSTSAERRGKAFGFHKAMDSTGAVLGPILILPILIGAATVTTDTYRTIFLLSTIPAFAALVIIILFLKERQGREERRLGRFIFETRGLGREFWLLMVVVSTFFLGEISYAFFILQGQKVGLGTVDIVLLYILFNIIFVLLALLSGSWSDRIGRRPVIAFSFLMFIATCVFMSAADSWWLLLIGFIIFGVYKGCSEGVLKAFVTDVAPKELRGTALGAYHTCVGLVMLPGGIFAGLLWDAFGPWATFGYGAILASVSIILLLIMTKNEKIVDWV